MSCLRTYHRFVSFLLIAAFSLGTLPHPVSAQNQINVNGTVPPTMSELPFEFESPNGKGIFRQDTDIEYVIRYGSQTLGVRDITISAEWSLGTFAPGVNAPSTEILDYVPGSATIGYNNTQAIIDPINRRITWHIEDFPAQTTDQELRFKLRTNSNYSNAIPVATFTVTARLQSDSIIIPKTLTQRYQYNHDPDPNRPRPPDPTATPTPTPTPPPNLSLRYIIVPQIRDTRASIELSTNIHSNATIHYGSTPSTMNQQITSLNDALYHFFTLDALEPDSQYYFQIEIEDAFRTRPSITSDIYTFKTARESEAAEINTGSIIITSNNNIVFSSLDIDSHQSGTVVLPTKTPFEFQFSVSDNRQVTSMLTIVRNKNLSQVLGINNIQKSSPHSNFSRITEIKPGVFAGRLLSQDEIGIHELLVKISDTQGNIIEQKIADIKTVQPLLILEKGTNQPIENAKVQLWIYNPLTQLYTYISPENLPITNPSYSEVDGHVPIVLPQGHYKAEISAILHENTTVEFTIGPGPGEEYPIVILEKTPFSLLNITRYYASVLSDLSHLTTNYVDRVSVSLRFFNVIAPLSLLLLITLTLLSLSARLKTSLWRLPHYFEHLWYKMTFRSLYSRFIVGEVRDGFRGDLLPGVEVILIDAVKNEIISKTRTNHAGEFFFPWGKAKAYKVSLYKKDYEIPPFMEYSKETISLGRLKLQLSPSEQALSPSFVHVTLHVLNTMFGFLFEVLLLLSLLFEMQFINTFGLPKVLPFLMLTVATIFLWILIGLHKIFRNSALFQRVTRIQS